MEKDKINIDQFFKASLHDFEGLADESMFDAIKEQLDQTPVGKVSIDDYFKNALSVFEMPAEDALFDDIKSKVDTTKVPVDQYFRDALLDFNSYALTVPFSEILNKLDRDKVIDDHFKNALQNYEGKAHDVEFEAIRERVLQVQTQQKVKRYAWLLALLLVPALFSVNHYLGTENKTASQTQNSEQVLNSTDKTKTPQGNPSAELKGSSESSYSNNSNSNKNTTTYTPVITSATSSKTETNSKANQGNAATSTAGNSIPVNPVTPKESEIAATSTPSENNTTTAESTTTATEIKPEDTKTKAPETVPVVVPTVVAPAGSKSTQSTTIRKPKPKFTVEVFASTSKNSRYLHTSEQSKDYFTARNAAEQATTRYNFGFNILRSATRLHYGIGLHDYQFGQGGSYQITKNIFDSTPHYDVNGKIIGYWHINYRDTTLHFNYNNNFNSIEIPFHVSYVVCKFARFDFEVGVSASLTYLAGVKGTAPTAEANHIITLNDNLKNFNRLGSSGTVNMKLNYNLTSRWQAGTEIYLKSGINSIYKKSTGINEIPYSFGVRWGLGYKF